MSSPYLAASTGRRRARARTLRIAAVLLLGAAFSACWDGVSRGTPPPSGLRTVAPSMTTIAGSGASTPSAGATMSGGASDTAGPHGRFVATGSMVAVRGGQVAALLPDGRVLIACGSDQPVTEVFDPRSGTFSATGPLIVPRTTGATATVLEDGRVLVAGGSDSSLDQNPLASAEVYDPTSGLFAATGPMRRGRSGHTASLLSDGRVLIAGGTDGAGGALSSAELYDPKSGTFTLTGSMTIPRSGHAAAVLADGRVLLAGGTDGSRLPLASAEIYDPGKERFTAVGPMSAGRMAASAVSLADGRVLVLGGNASMVNEIPLASAETFAPDTDQFTGAGQMAEARDGQTASLLEDGRVLVAGGGSDNVAELFDPQTGQFAPAGSLSVTRATHTATVLKDGSVLIAGGVIGGADERSAELYLP